MHRILTLIVGFSLLACSDGPERQSPPPKHTKPTPKSKTTPKAAPGPKKKATPVAKAAPVAKPSTEAKSTPTAKPAAKATKPAPKRPAAPLKDPKNARKPFKAPQVGAERCQAACANAVRLSLAAKKRKSGGSASYVQLEKFATADCPSQCAKWGTKKRVACMIAAKRLDDLRACSQK